jgi:hypothetical protein
LYVVFRAVRNGRGVGLPGRQETPPEPRPLATVILGPVVVPLYFARRPLREGETREGGVGWNILGKRLVSRWSKLCWS